MNIRPLLASAPTTLVVDQSRSHYGFRDALGGSCRRLIFLEWNVGRSLAAESLLLVLELFGAASIETPRPSLACC